MPCRLIVLMGLILVASPLPSQTTWYVDQAAPPPWSGTMAEPYPNIQLAIAAASSGDTIMVALGNYGGLITFANKALTLIGTQGKAVTKIRGSASFGNSELIILNNGPGVSRVQGFTFDAGAGMTMTVKTGNTSVEFLNCDFSSKGIEIQQSIASLSIDGAVFDGATISGVWANSAFLPGSIVIKNSEFKNALVGDPFNYVVRVRGSMLAVDNCDFHDNGNALWSDATSVTITNSDFTQNVRACSLPRVATISDSNFTNCNHAILPGLALEVEDCAFAGGSAIIPGPSTSNSSAALCRFSGCTIANYASNEALFGITTGNNLVLESCRIEQVTNPHLVYANGALTMVGCILAASSCSLQPGGPIMIDSCSFIDNMPIYGPLIIAGQAATIRNSILRGGNMNFVLGVAVLEHCNVEGGWSGPGGSNVDVDPLFVDPANGDYHLQAGSPMVDAGGRQPSAISPTTDIDGDARPIGRFADVGADEFDSGPFALAGTDDDIALAAWIDGQRVNGLGGAVTGGDLVTVAIESPTGALLGTPVWLYGELFATGGSPILPSGHPAIHMNLMAADLLFDPVLATTLPGWSFGLPATVLWLGGPVPYGFAGNSYRLQAFTLSPIVSNGWYGATEAVDLDHF